MPSGSFSNKARNSNSITNRKSCGGNKKAGLAPRATGPTQFRNVAFNTSPTVNFKVHKGDLPCPTNYSNNPGGQCAGGVGALASTRSRGCNNLTICKKCPTISLDPYVGDWRVTVADVPEISTFVKRNKNDVFNEQVLNTIEQLINATIVGDTIVVNDGLVFGVFAELSVPGENCNKIYLIFIEAGLKIEANPVEFSFTVEDITVTFTKL